LASWLDKMMVSVMETQWEEQLVLMMAQ